MDGPPPPPPPHGTNPKNTAGGGSGGLPPGNYDIFIIPPHSAGGGFVYLPSLAVQTNSFIAGVASTLVALGIYKVAEPTVKLWVATISMGVASGGNAVVLLIVIVGILGWAWGKMQAERATGAAPGAGGPGTGHPGAGGPAGGGYHRAQSPPNAGYPGAGPPPQGTPGAGPQPGQWPPPPPPPRGSGPNTWGAGPDPDSEWEKAQEEERKEEERKRAEEAKKKKQDEEQRRREEEEKKRREEEERKRREDEERKRREEEDRRRREEEQRRKEEEYKRREEEQRRREEESKRREEEQKRKEEAERQARAKAEKEKWEKMRAREREQREREARERIAKEKIQKEKERREREAREREALEAEARARIEKEIREKLEAEQRAKAEEEAKRRAAEERAAAEARAAKEKADAEAKAAKEQADKERAERLKAARERAERERAARLKSEAEKTAAASRRSATYGGVGGERTDIYGRPVGAAAPSVTSTQSSPIKATLSATSSPKKSYEKPSAKSYLGSQDGETSFRPYDQPPKRPTMPTPSQSSAYSESSYAPSQSTARTTPPPSQRGPYSTNDPDKIQIKAVYLFNDLFPKPVAQLVAGIGNVTDGLVLKITTEGLFIDDDVRHVAQREWDIKAWTMKLVETGERNGKHLIRASIRDTNNKKYVFILDDRESWKVATGLQRLRRGSQVRALGVNAMPVNEVWRLLDSVGFA